MTDKTDFTQIAADFAAHLKTVDHTEDGAAAQKDALAECASAEEMSETSNPSLGAIEHQAISAAGSDDIDTGDTTAIQNTTSPSDAETLVAEEGDMCEPMGGAVDSDDASSGHGAGEHDAAGQMVDDAGNEGGIFRDFPSAPRQPGEFTLPLCDLVIGRTSDGGNYDFDSGAGESLLHAVLMPQNIAPIVVMMTGDAWHVIDGWARVEAFRAQFGNTANIQVRVVEWAGTSEDAIYNRFAETFLTLKSRKIDKSILLRRFHSAWVVPQQVLAARIGWTESRVTRELAAAAVMLEAPRFAELHVKAGDPPIDYLYKVQQARDEAATDDMAHPMRAPEKSVVAKLDAKLEALLAKPERYATAQALAKLGIGTAGKARATPAKSEPADVPAALPALQVIDCVEDSSGDAVAMIEVGADQLPSIRLLVDATVMDDRRKAEVRHLVHEAIDRLLGL